MYAVNLRTEYLINPIGIDVACPRLFWNCENGVKQTAYEIMAIDEFGKELWSSGKISSESMRCTWGGDTVKPKTKVFWSVRLWDETDTCGDWSEANFETGVDVWSAQWITGNYRVNKKQRYPVDCFRKCFNAVNVVKARLYITACGLYEAKINGKKAGSFVLAPGHTDYRKRVQYQTYDVTELLINGENQLTVQLADGWYRGSIGAWGLKNQYGTETKLLAQLEITEKDGGTYRICTDESWDWSNDGPICFADNKDGEVVNACCEPFYGGKAKKTSHNVRPTASNNVPVTEHECFSAQKVVTPTGKTVLDFGQNIAGYVSFLVKAKTGQKIVLRFGEMLDKNGELTQKNIQCTNKYITTPLQQVVYTCKEGENAYKTTFSVFGFRYAQVDADFEIDPSDFTAISVYSDMEQTGWFESSNELLNKFVDATIWSAKGNHLDVPTDCPTRERHGWSGDAQIFFDTAAYLFQYATFSTKYVQDLYDWQTKDGKLPQIAPYGGVDFYMSWMNGSVGWADAGVLIPYRYWKQYGDDSLVKRHYDGMARYARFMAKRCHRWTPLSRRIPLKREAKRYIVNFGQSYGEWAEPAEVFPNHWTNMVLPHPEESTAYTAFVMEKMEEIAGYLGRTEDQTYFAKYRDRCKYAYQQLVRHADHSLDTDRQAKLVRPLYMGLLDAEQKTFAQKRLIQALENYGWRLGTGFLSTPLILDVLTEYNVEAAYRLLENQEMPGWIFMTRNGATTIWESWEGTQAQDGIGSLNHYSKGAVCAWLFKTMCGIRVDGENHFVIAPMPGGSFTYAKAGFRSVYGQVECGWERNGDSYRLSVKVPCNTTAEVRLPNGKKQLMSSGQFTFEW